MYNIQLENIKPFILLTVFTVGRIIRLLRLDTFGMMLCRTWSESFRASLNKRRESADQRSQKLNISQFTQTLVSLPWIMRKARLHREYNLEFSVEPGLRKTGDAYSIMERMHWTCTIHYGTCTNWSCVKNDFRTNFRTNIIKMVNPS